MVDPVEIIDAVRTSIAWRHSGAKKTTADNSQPISSHNEEKINNMFNYDQVSTPFLQQQTQQTKELIEMQQFP